ncbi:flagellar basal body P-ring protein FlgI, partial [bacterium]|nr:flagellar basal body P-ring protein FlgI [bacterium]
MMDIRTHALVMWLLVFAAVVFSPNSGQCEEGVRLLGDLCRIKGQETNTLQGWGLVTGLRGTGDSDSSATSMA